MFETPPLKWLKIVDDCFLQEKDSNGRSWWTGDKDTTISLQAYPGALKEGTDTRSLEALRESAYPKHPEGGLSLVSFRLVETDGITGLESLLKIPQAPSGMTYIGQVLYPFTDFTYVLEIECREIGVTGLRETVQTLADLMLGIARPVDGGGIEGGGCSDDEVYDRKFPDHPLSRLRWQLRRIEACLRVAPELKRFTQIELPAGEKIAPLRTIHRWKNDDAPIEQLRSLLGVKLGDFYAPQLYLWAKRGLVWFPSCSIPCREGYLVLRLDADIIPDQDMDPYRFNLSFQEKPHDLKLKKRSRHPVILDPVSVISVELSSPIEAVELYEGQFVFGKEELIRDIALIIRRADGVEAAFTAHDGYGINFTVDPEMIDNLRGSAFLRWDSRWGNPAP